MTEDRSATGDGGRSRATGAGVDADENADGAAPDPTPDAGGRPSNRRVRETYDRVAGLYARTVAPFEVPSQRAAIDRLDPSEGATAVDVCCGPGLALAELARRVGPDGRVYGVDAAPEMVDRARRQRGRGPVEAVVGDARRLPLATGTAEVACLFDALDLFDREDRRAVLTELRRVLAPDGRLCVVTMDRADLPESAFLRAYEWAFRTVPWVRAVGCRPVPARPALRAAGFRVDSTERHRRGGVWPVASYVCRPRSD